MTRIGTVIIPVLQKLAEDIAALNIEDDERPGILNEVVTKLKKRIKGRQRQPLNAATKAAIADYVSGVSVRLAAPKHGLTEQKLYYYLGREGLLRSRQRANDLLVLGGQIHPSSVPIDPIVASRVIDAVANEFDVAPSAILSPEDRRHPVARARSVAGWILRKHYKAPNQDVMDAVALSHFNWSAIGKRIERQPGMKTRMANVMARLSVDEAGPAP